MAAKGELPILVVNANHCVAASKCDSEHGCRHSLMASARLGAYGDVDQGRVPPSMVQVHASSSQNVRPRVCAIAGNMLASTKH